MLAADAVFCTILACQLELFVATTLHGHCGQVLHLVIAPKGLNAQFTARVLGQDLHTRLQALTVNADYMLCCRAQSDTMNKLQWCVLLLATAIVCTESHRLLSAESQPTGRKLAETDEIALEHQRILAELEEVHQLRERMLQQGEQSLL